jgi:branched-chain amino acid transport system substrate-binding protein
LETHNRLPIILLISNPAKLPILAFLGALCLAMIAWAAIATAEEQPIRIGVISSFDPEAAIWSLSANIGLRKAAAEINAAGGISGRKLELIFEDDQFRPKNAVAVYHKLRERDRVQFIIGPQFEHTLAPVVRLANEHKQIVISTVGTGPKNKVPNGYVFHSSPPDRTAARFLARRIGQDRRKHVLIYAQEETYSMNFAQGIIDSLPNTVTHELITFATDTVDYRPLFIRIRSAKPDALVFMFPTPAVAAKIYHQLNELGIRLPVYTNEIVHSSTELLEKAGELADGTLYPVVKFDEQNARVRAFLDTLPERPNLPLYAVLAYDTLHYLANIVERVGADPEKVKSELYALSYDGVFARYAFDPYGDLIVSDWEIWQVRKDGYGPAPRSEPKP